MGRDYSSRCQICIALPANFDGAGAVQHDDLFVGRKFRSFIGILPVWIAARINIKRRTKVNAPFASSISNASARLLSRPRAGKAASPFTAPMLPDSNAPQCQSSPRSSPLLRSKILATMLKLARRRIPAAECDGLDSSPSHLPFAIAI
jgi:hypothetical protein